MSGGSNPSFTCSKIWLISNTYNWAIPLFFLEYKYEDFVGNELAVLQHIYNQFDLPGFEDAKDNFSQYLQSQESYQVNQYELQAETIDTITEAWKFAFEAWPYDLPDDIKAIGST
jgi:hypothetical protein